MFFLVRFEILSSLVNFCLKYILRSRLITNTQSSEEKLE